MPPPEFEHFLLGFSGTDIGYGPHVIVAFDSAGSPVGDAINDNIAELGTLIANFIQENSTATNVVLSSIQCRGTHVDVYP